MQIEDLIRKITNKCTNQCSRIDKRCISSVSSKGTGEVREQGGRDVRVHDPLCIALVGVGGDDEEAKYRGGRHGDERCDSEDARPHPSSRR